MLKKDGSMLLQRRSIEFMQSSVVNVASFRLVVSDQARGTCLEISEALAMKENGTNELASPRAGGK